MQVKELMSTTSIVCGPQDTVHHAAELMWKHDLGCLPVVDSDRHVIGMITDRDICMAAYTQGQQLAWIPVSSAMSHVVHSCAPTDSILLAEELMRMHQVRRLPVILAGRLQGMLSLHDVARAVTSRHRGRASHDGLDGVVTTLARIGAPREQVQAAQ